MLLTTCHDVVNRWTLAALHWSRSPGNASLRTENVSMQARIGLLSVDIHWIQADIAPRSIGIALRPSTGIRCKLTSVRSQLTSLHSPLTPARCKLAAARGQLT